MDILSQITAFSSNQLLVAGVGTTLVAACAMRAGAVAEGLRDLLAAQLYTTLTARTNGATVTRLSLLLARHRVHASGATYSLSDGNELRIGYGPGLARWRGIWIRYVLSIDTKAKIYARTEILNLTFLTRDRGAIERFVREALDNATKARDTIDVHHRFEGCWQAISRRKRAIETVFANAGTRDAIVEKVRWFLANEEWYVRRGLNYKLVVLLHGVPGTGKSSLIQAVASHFNRDLYCVETLLTLAPDLGELTNGILAIEDIDTLGELKRADKTEPVPPGLLVGPRTSLHGVLNTLDGLGTPHGLVTFVTTNHIEALDPALVRPCRIDLVVEVTTLEWEAFAAMFVSFFDGAAPALPREAYVPQTGARLQEIFMAAGSPAAASAAVRARGSGMRAAA